jgi:hypothetical protein
MDCHSDFEEINAVISTIERQSKHNHQCEQGEQKKPSTGLPENWQAVDGLFVVLSAGEFESCVSPKTPKSGEFASPSGYFCFTTPDSSNARNCS